MQEGSLSFISLPTLVVSCLLDKRHKTKQIQRTIDTENKLVVARGDGGMDKIGGGDYEEVQTSSYKINKSGTPRK